MDSFELIRDLKKVTDTIDYAQAYISSLQDKIDRLQTRNQHQPDFYRFKIIRQVMKLIFKGYDEQTAIEEVAHGYSHILRAQDISSLWHHARRERNALQLYARAYMARKMHDSGMKIKDIAAVMDVSRNSVTKLLQTDIVLD